jgi:DNA ligase D-like protein (predicted 3'-phosphoesterase)
MTRDGGIFVVQRHDATTLHFDLRLEIEGVLVSWAVPRGPSLDPGEKRLAVRVGDHELSHATFEGRGAGGGPGTVIVWDTGRYLNVTERKGVALSAAEALDAGHLKIVVRGEKLVGAFALTHTRLGGDSKNWILVKVDDEFADRDRDLTATENVSVLSGRTNEDLEES